MPRIRTLKPETWGHAKVSRVSRDARLLFIGLVSTADDAGRLLGSPKTIAGNVFPNDDDVGPSEVAEWLDELERVGLAERYEVEGVRYVVLPGFTEHQKISKPTPSRLPEPPAKAPGRVEGVDNDAQESPGDPAEDLGSRAVDLDLPPGGEPSSPETEIPGGSSEAQRLVAGYVEAFRATHRGRDPDKAWRSACGKAVKAHLEQGRDPDELAAALVLIAERNKNPAVLTNVLADIDSGLVKVNGHAPAPAIEQRPGYHRDWHDNAVAPEITPV